MIPRIKNIRSTKGTLMNCLSSKKSNVKVTNSQAKTVKLAMGVKSKITSFFNNMKITSV